MFIPKLHQQLLFVGVNLFVECGNGIFCVVDHFRQAFDGVNEIPTCEWRVCIQVAVYESGRTGHVYFPKKRFIV